MRKTRADAKGTTAVRDSKAKPGNKKKSWGEFLSSAAGAALDAATDPRIGKALDVADRAVSTRSVYKSQGFSAAARVAAKGTPVEAHAEQAGDIADRWGGRSTTPTDTESIIARRSRAAHFLGLTNRDDVYSHVEAARVGARGLACGTACGAVGGVVAYHVASECLRDIAITAAQECAIAVVKNGGGAVCAASILDSCTS